MFINKMELKVLALLSFFIVQATLTWAESDLVALAVEDDKNDGPEMTASHISKEGQKSYKVFKPTHEWQPIPEGMAIPQGAHVRMNMETGVNEVKLMDGVPIDGSKNGPQISVLSDGKDDALLNSRHKIFSQEELADALEGIKPEEIVTDEDRERVSREFRSIEELKKDFEKISASMKTDVQILRGLVDELNNNEAPPTTDRLLTILEDMEYLSHQIDNGVELAKMGAIPFLLKYSNGSDSSVAEAALLCLGGMMQSNKFVQESVLNAGAMSVIYKILGQTASSSISHLQSRALFVLSTLLRHNPPAQDYLLQTGGVTLLKKLFTSCFTEAPMNERFAVKVIGLVGDLVAESDEALIAKLKEYENLQFRQAVSAADWCKSSTQLLASSQHNTREKALRLMTLLAKDCHSTYFDQSVQNALATLLDEYRQLSAIEDQRRREMPPQTTSNGEELHSSLVDTGEDDFFGRMAGIVTNLLSSISQLQHELASSRHQEL